MGITRSILLWGSRSQQLREILPRYRFVRKAVSRFMPGEEIGAALEAAEILRENGIASILTHLGENVTEETEADQITRHYREVLDHVRTRGLDCQISVKLTQLGLDLSPELGYTNLRSIADHAAGLQNFVWIDMEASAYTDLSLELFRRARSEYPNIGICLQSYLYRTAHDLDTLLPLSPAIRLVKGAYAEPESVAFQKKKDVDANFLALATQLLGKARQDGVWPVFATHDRGLIRRLQEETATIGLSKEASEFQMLYGIRREDQIRLARESYRVRVLISYGTAWFPWYMRRLAERPANVLFVLRNLVGR
ncbi:MAG: proline dehydrogenase family protein [Bacteroidota bacterium]